MKSYTIIKFQEEFGTEEVCLEYIFNKNYGTDYTCETCGNSGCYYRIAKRKVYSCSHCATQVSPTAGTIFHKSSTPLKLWFYAIFLFSNSKNGVSGKELQRQLGVTYKTAWRIAKQIRELLDEDAEKFTDGTVEVDETYVGGKKRGVANRGRSVKAKTPVVGIVARNGKVKAIVTKDTKSSTVKPFIRDNVDVSVEVMTDDYRSYNGLAKEGYTHKTINHSKGRYAEGDVYTNTIEGFWSQLKRSISGTYHYVSAKYLQAYVNEFAFRYNHRDVEMLFPVMVQKI